MMTCYQLSIQQLNALDALVAQCRDTDKYTIPIYQHLLATPRSLPSVLLHFHQNQLLGFLSAFFFHTDRCEISLMVSPNARRNHLATRLLTSIMPVLQQVPALTTVSFQTPSHNTAWLQEKGFTYTHSEYEMQRCTPTPNILPPTPITVRLATPGDIPALCALDDACFDQTSPQMPQRFHSLIQDPQYQILVAWQAGRLIGKAHLRHLSDSTRLSDIAIWPACQKRGYGSALLAHAINHTLAMGQSNLLLDVEANNHQALALYQKQGFQIYNACDYLSIPLADLKPQLST